MNEAAEAALDGVGEERRTTPVELLWGLVFVFAVTQVTTLLSRDLTWAGFGRSMLVLALVWWSWSAFVWAANAQTMSSPTLRPSLLLASAFIFVAGSRCRTPSAVRERCSRAPTPQFGSCTWPSTRMPRGEATHRGRRSPGLR